MAGVHPGAKLSRTRWRPPLKRCDRLPARGSERAWHPAPVMLSAEACDRGPSGGRNPRKDRARPAGLRTGVVAGQASMLSGGRGAPKIVCSGT